VTVVDASRVTDGVLALLETATGALVGDGVPPTPADADDLLALSQGYLVLTQVQPTGIPNPTPYLNAGWGGQTEAMTRCRFAIKATGVQRNQVERLAERAANAVVERAPAGGWVNALTVVDHQVIDRRRAGRLPLDVENGTFTVGVLVDVTVHATA